MNEQRKIEHFRSCGIKYKYPSCCIDFFIKKVLSRERTNVRNKSASGKDGFLPCDYHTDLIYKTFDNSSKISWRRHTKNGSLN